MRGTKWIKGPGRSCSSVFLRTLGFFAKVSFLIATLKVVCTLNCVVVPLILWIEAICIKENLLMRLGAVISIRRAELISSSANLDAPRHTRN